MFAPPHEPAQIFEVARAVHLVQSVPASSRGLSDPPMSVVEAIEEVLEMHLGIVLNINKYL